jgi:hypothetical protein
VLSIHLAITCGLMNVVGYIVARKIMGFTVLCRKRNATAVLLSGMRILRRDWRHGTDVERLVVLENLPNVVLREPMKLIIYIEGANSF